MIERSPDMIEDLILIRLILDEITKYGTYILYTCPNFMPFNWYWGLQNNVQLFKEPYNYKQTERLKNMTFIMKLEMKTYKMVFPSICHPLGCMYANEINVVNKCQSVFFFSIYQRYNAWFWKQKTRVSNCYTLFVYGHKNKIILYISD